MPLLKFLGYCTDIIWFTNMMYKYQHFFVGLKVLGVFLQARNIHWHHMMFKYPNQSFWSDITQYTVEDHQSVISESWIWNASLWLRREELGLCCKEGSSIPWTDVVGRAKPTGDVWTGMHSFPLSYFQWIWDAWNSLLHMRIYIVLFLKLSSKSCNWWERQPCFLQQQPLSSAKWCEVYNTAFALLNEATQTSANPAVTLHNWFWEGTLAIHCYHAASQLQQSRVVSITSHKQYGGRFSN